ncbi:MAG: elongation factor G [Niabella sp.]
MQTFDQKHIKNVAFVGAHGAGKTTLTECMLFEAGLLNRRGTIEESNTVSDFHKIEKEKQMSIFTTLVHTEWRNYKINILDTPGLDDFIGEIVQGVKAADTIVMVINAQQGVEPGTEVIGNYINRFRKPTVFAINQIDHAYADFDKSFASLKEHFGQNVVQVQYPVHHEGHIAIIDVLKMKMYVFKDEGGKPDKLPIPDSEIEKANSLHNELVEKAAENEESLMEIFFDKGTLTEDEMREGIKSGMAQAALFPVFCLSALKNMGSGRLMGFIDNVAPSAVDKPPFTTSNGKELRYDQSLPTSAFVFKTQYEPNIGKINFVKVITGELTIGQTLIDAVTGKEEHVNNIFIVDGTKRSPVEKLVAGDIGALIKLREVETNTTLHDKALDVVIMPMEFPQAKLRKALFADNKAAEDKMTEVVKKITSQDPTYHVAFSKELKQWVLSCQGDLHLSVFDYMLKNDYGIGAHYEDVRVAYRETIQKPAISFYRHKKQSGGAGQFAEVRIKIEPYYDGIAEPEGFSLRGKEEIALEWGGKLVFYNCIVGGVIDQRFIPSVLKGILESMSNGPLSGSYVRDVRVMLFDGKMHPVDSNDISFKIAGARAFSTAVLDAQPKLMEPIDQLEISVPEALMGDVMGELQTRRAMIMGMDSVVNYQKVTAKIPQQELSGFANSLRSLTQGRGTFTSSFDGFMPVAANLQEEIVQKHRKEVEAEV